MKKTRNRLMGVTLGMAVVGGGIYGISKMANDPYTISGELVQDYIQNPGTNWEFYRILVQTDKGLIAYPILGDPEEIRDLERNFVSREESSSQKGDIVYINPKTHVFSLDEVVLLPKNIKK